MQLVHGYAVGAYAVSCGLAVFASFQTFSISRMVRSDRLRALWLLITFGSAAIEVLHAGATLYLAGIPDDSAFSASATILLGAGSIFVGLALLMRSSMASLLQLAELKQIAFSDALTSVGNRRAFDCAVQQGPERGGGGLIMIDIDHFKRVNDTHGHEVGDLLLKQVARLLESSSGGQPVYRIGGEEFCILVSNVEEDAPVIAEDCRTAVERMALLHQTPSFAVTVSAGVALVGDGDTVVSVRRRADAALYAAKRTGRNRVVLSEPDEAGAVRSARIVPGGRATLERAAQRS